MEPIRHFEISWPLGTFKKCLYLFSECRTSATENPPTCTKCKKPKYFAQLDQPCQFPFIVKGKTYYTCTYDYSYLTGYKPWCSVSTDENNLHNKGRTTIDGVTKKFWGICDDTDQCTIPPKCKLSLKRSVNFWKNFFLSSQRQKNINFLHIFCPCLWKEVGSKVVGIFKVLIRGYLT